MAKTSAEMLYGLLLCTWTIAGAWAQANTCDNYGKLSSGPYTIYANQWGSQYGNGSQCMQLDGVDMKGTSQPDDDVLAWTTNFSWQNAPSQVKSFTNVQSSTIVCKSIPQFQTIQTSWAWSASGSGLNGNVAYDMMLGTACSATPSYEIMIWLGIAGGISPLSDSGYPPTKVIQATVGGIQWKLVRGVGGSTTTYSFVAKQPQSNYQGNLVDFLTYLKQNQGVDFSNQYLISLHAGAEVFTGTNGVLKTTAYNIHST